MLKQNHRCLNRRFRRAPKPKLTRKQARNLTAEDRSRIDKIKTITQDMKSSHDQNDLMITKLQKEHNPLTLCSLDERINSSIALIKGLPTYDKYFSGYRFHQTYFDKIINGTNKRPTPNYLTDEEKSHHVDEILKASQLAHDYNHETLTYLTNEINNLDADAQTQCSTLDFVFGERVAMCERITEHLLSNLPTTTTLQVGPPFPHYYKTHSLPKDVMLFGVYIVCGILALWALISVPLIWHLFSGWGGWR